MSINVPNQTLAVDQWVVEITVPLTVGEGDGFQTTTQRRLDILTTSLDRAMALAREQYPDPGVTIDAVRKSTSQRQFLLDPSVLA